MARDYGPLGRCGSAIGACDEPGAGVYFLADDPDYRRVACGRHLREWAKRSAEHVRRLNWELDQMAANQASVRAALIDAGLEPGPTPGPGTSEPEPFQVVAAEIQDRLWSELTYGPAGSGCRWPLSFDGPHDDPQVVATAPDGAVFDVEVDVILTPRQKEPA